jgi:hypothetical protein
VTLFALQHGLLHDAAARRHEPVPASSARS